MPGIRVTPIVIGCFLLIAGVVLFTAASSVAATSYHTIIVDGTNDFAADEVFSTSSGGYTAYATWDATNLYLGSQGLDVGSGETSQKWITWYIDTDPQCGPNGGSGSNYAAPFNNQLWSLPFRADYFLQVRTDEGFNQLNSWNGTAWTPATYTGIIFDNDGDNFIELSVPRADIGNPETIRILGYFINEQGGGEWTYASWPATSLAGGDGYKPFGTFYHWYDFELVAGVSPNDPANNSPAQNCTVNDNTAEWGFGAETGTGSGAYVTGPAVPPAGTGSARLTTPAAADGHVIGTVAFPGVRLADISALSYSTYRDTGGAAQVPALQFNINYDLNSATVWQGRLVYEPYQQLPAPTIPDDTWQTWDTLDGGNGRWWATDAPGNVTCPMSSPCPWSTILSTWPNAGINFANSQFLSKAGAGWAGFDGNVDNIAITINGASYAFDLEQYLPVHNITQDTYHLTIQDGVDNAVSGDEIEIDPGTYVENVVVDRPVTLRGFGDGVDPANDTILDGTTIGGRGIFINTGITDVTIEQLRVINYAGANSSGIWANGQNHNFIVQDVTANNNGPGFVAAAGGVYMNGPVNNVLIDNVVAHNNWGRGIVIWNGLKTNITITNNDVRNNNCCGIELQDGTASGVTITGNTVEDNSDSGISAVGLTAGAGANLIANNVVTDNGRFGIEVKLADGTGLDNGDGSIVVENNTVSRTFVPADLRDLAGISVYRRGWLAGNVDIPVGVVVRNNTVSGYQQTTVSDGFGIVVEGISMVVTGNTLNNNDVGVQLQAGHLPYTPFTNINGNDSNLADDYFGRGNSPVGCAAITGNTFSGNSVDTRQVGPVGGGTVTNVDTAVSFCSIQAAIDDVTTLDGHTILVSPGEYVESITISKPGLQILGPNVGVDPNTGVRGPEAVIRPATLTITETQWFVVEIPTGVGQVLFDGFTVDGDNLDVTTGVDINGANTDASYLIYPSNVNADGPITITNNIVQNGLVNGFVGYTGGSAVSSNNLVAYNRFDNINNGVNEGRAIAPRWNYYANIIDNVVTRSVIGIYNDNVHQASAMPTVVWSGNYIAAERSPIWYNLVYGSATAPSILDNHLVAEPSTFARWDGMWLTSLGGSIDPIISGNYITATLASTQSNGYHLWNDTTTAPGGINITGGSVTDVDYGIWVNNWDGYPTSGGSNAGPSTATVTDVLIDDVAIAAVYAKDNPLEPDGDPVTITIIDSALTNAPVSLLVEGPDATATVKGSTVDTVGTALSVTDGSLFAYANNITNFTTGINSSSPIQFDARHNWWGAHFVQPAGVDAASWDYRLGAAVQTWAEGDGGTTLTDIGNGGTTSLGGGTGTAVIVSHGRPTTIAEAPFGNGVAGHYDVMCSDFYDLFVINAPAGTWTASIPLDDSPGCDQTLIEEVVFWIPFGTDYNVECSPSGNTACWDPIDPVRVTAVGDNLEVDNLTVTELSGTPFVAGNDQQLDPTAVTLNNLRTTGHRSQIVVAIALLMFTAVALLTFVVLRKQPH